MAIASRARGGRRAGESDDPSRQQFQIGELVVASRASAKQKVSLMFVLLRTDFPSNKGVRPPPSPLPSTLQIFPVFVRRNLFLVRLYRAWTRLSRLHRSGYCGLRKLATHKLQRT